MSRITDFYLGTGTDDEGRTFDEVLAFDNTKLERDHTYIQFLFPLPEPSVAQPQSPIATPEDYETIQGNPEMLGRLKHAAGRMRQFYQRTTSWRRVQDHNHLRITRILRCLTLCGLWVQAELFMRERRREFPQGVLTDTTRRYWEEALETEPAWLDE